MSLAVPSPARWLSASPQLQEGQLVPAPSSSPAAPGSGGTSASPVPGENAMDTDAPTTHPAYPPLSAEEERAAFTAVYDATLKKDAVFCVVPQKWSQNQQCAAVTSG